MPRDSTASPDRPQVEHMSVCPFGSNGYMRICIEKLRAWGTCLFPSARHRRVPTWNTVSSFGFPWTDNKTRSTSLREVRRRQQGWPRIGEHQVQGEAEGIQFFQPEEEKFSSCSTPLSKGDCREDGALFRYMQGIEKRQWLHLAARDTPVGICHAVRAPGEIAQRFGNPHPWKLSKLDSMSPVQPEPTLKLPQLWVRGWSGSPP